MDVLLINPPADFPVLREGRCQGSLENTLPGASKKWIECGVPQISLAYIASVLEKNKFKIGLIDCIASSVNTNRLLGIVKTEKPALIISNTTTNTIDKDANIIKEIKKINKDIVCCFFGAHVTADSKKVLSNYPWLDLIIRGEPELTSLELAKKIKEESDFSKVKGTTIRINSKIIFNKDRTWIGDLDSLPWPARHLLPNDMYRDPFFKKGHTLLQISRGCLNNCIFCVAPIYYGHKFRKRKAEKIVDELEYDIIGKHKISCIRLWADIATLDKQFMIGICKEIIERKLTIKWITNAHVNTVDLEMLRIMKKAGCVGLGFGVESGNQQILDDTKKGIRLERVQEAFNLCKKAGIESFAFFIFGLPGETKETINETIKFAIKLDPDYADFYSAVPYPGTEFYEIAKKENWIVDKDLEKYEVGQSVIKTSQLDPRLILEYRKLAYRRFYLRPKKLVRYFLKRVHSWEEFKQLMGAGFNFIKWLNNRN